MTDNIMMSSFRMQRAARATSAFTLIELLVVIAIIGILAGMIMTSFGGASKKKTRSRLETQMNEIQTAIEEYHSKKGSYPPSTAKNLDRPPLYFELVGSFYDKSAKEYQTLDGQTRIPIDKVKSLFQTDGFQNSGLKAEEAENFYKNLKTSGFFVDADGRTLLGAPIKSTDGMNLRWRYNSLNPTNNPGRYDLWVEWTEKDGEQPEIIGNWIK